MVDSAQLAMWHKQVIHDAYQSCTIAYRLTSFWFDEALDQL